MFVLLGDRMNGRRFPHTITVIAIFVITFLVTPIHAHSAPPSVGAEEETSSPGFPVSTVVLFAVLAVLVIAAVIVVRRLERKERR